MPNEREEGEGECERRKKVGHYVLGPCLGEGSFAKVRVGTHLISREKVAVKVVSKRLIIRREAARRNFRREALLLQHVRHPHIVCLLEAMETTHSYYLVFELAPNGNLLAYLTARKCLREGEARRFMRQIVSAVDHLHRSSIVHRDLKLENCLLNASWDIKIIDFGFSALCQRDSGLHTQCGSPAYAAPEIFGNRRYGPAVDLWSIGVCLYAMVVGRLPFLPHPPTNLTQLHALILKGPVIPAFLSPGLQQLLTGLLEVQESRRLSVTDLLSQPWLTSQHSQPIARYPPVSQAPPPAVDTQIVRYMTTVFRFSESDVIHSVTERKLNAPSATYHLLKRHMEGERSAEEAADNEDGKEGENPADGDHGKAKDAPPVRAFRRSAVSEYGWNISRPYNAHGARPVVSEYSRPTAAAAEEEEEEEGDRGESRSGCPVLRSHILTPSAQSPRGGGGGGSDDPGERRKGSVEAGLRDYKQCILYLKEARHAFALGGRPLSHLPPHLLTKSTAKLPVLNLHPRTTPNPLGFQGHHGNQGNGARPGEGHQCQDGARPQAVSTCSHDVKLNVKGRPALLERAKGAAAGDRADPSSALLGYSHASVASQEVGRLPPPPPNTAQGSRMPVRAQPSPEGDSGSPRPSSPGSGHSQFSLRDPFARDTWRAVLQHELRLAGENEAGGRKSKGVSFVPPLSSPKALTSRDVSATARQHNYFLVRQLTADLNRRRVTPAARKVTAAASVPNPAPATTTPRLQHRHNRPQLRDITQNDENEDKASLGSSDDGGFGDALETERFLTPVIRVTITSTSKQ